jgi:hypothetical protein
MRGWMAGHSIGTAWARHTTRSTVAECILSVWITFREPEVNPEEPAWLKKALERFPKSAPIVVFTQRQWFDLNPDGERVTSDGYGGERVDVKESCGRN